MKKFLLIAVAAFGMLMTACSKDEVAQPIGGEESVVTFTVEAPVMATRAHGDGLTATQLFWAVYDKNDHLLFQSSEVTVMSGKEATVEIPFVNGMAYNILFWAEAVQSPYSVDWANLEVGYTNAAALVSNSEKYDAFYCYFTELGEVTGPVNEDVELKRPFAQLNIITNDHANAEKSGLNVDKVSVAISEGCDKFNLANGVGIKADANTVITFDEATKLADDHLAVNYLFTGGEKSLVNVTFAYTDGDLTKGGNASGSMEFASVPVQRNYRTNIVGSLLTSEGSFDIIIDKEFEGEENDSRIFNAIDLQAALDAAPENATTVIALGANIEANLTDIQKPGRKVVIEGRGYKYNGTIRVHSNSNHYADAALTIKDLNFETSIASVNFIEALENGSERYSCNITVENCTFTATGAAENTAVGVQIKASKNAKVIGCTATDVHSLIQAQSCDQEVLVQNCEVNGKNGVAFKQVKNAVVEGTTITATEYGIRFDGNTDNYGIVVKNNTVTANQPFIVRKMTGANNTIALEGDNTLTVSAASISTETPAYQIVITNGSDDEAYVKPTGTYTLTGADNFLVYPRDVYFLVATWDEFTAALAANEPKIKLTDNIEYSANYQLQKDVVIDLNGKSMTLPMINIHKNVTIKNGTINGKVYARKNSEIVFNNVKFSGAVADNLSTEGHLAIQGGCKSLYAKDCLFSPTSVSGSQTKPLSFEGGSTIMKFEDCEFKSSPYKKQVYFNSLSATGSLDFTNCNFNNKTPNIMFAAACPLTNLTMSGTTKLSSVTLETNRAKDAVTAEDLAYLRESLIANNSMSSVRLFYAGGSSEYIR